MTDYKPGEKIENVCCQGYAWEVLFTIVDVWGICENPDCQELDSISHKDPDDLEELTP